MNDEIEDNERDEILELSVLKFNELEKLTGEKYSSNIRKLFFALDIATNLQFATITNLTKEVAELKEEVNKLKKKS